jgi:integrase
MTLRGIRRVRAQPQRRVAPLLIKELFAICSDPGDSVRDIRDRALLLVGFAGAFRRSELVAIDAEDVERSTTGMAISIRLSKTDQEGRGRRVFIPRGHGEICPVAALDRWLAVSRISRGPVFRSVKNGGTVMARRLSGEAVAPVIKQRIRSLGRDASRYSGHSLRAGFASSAASAAVPTWRIRAQTGHRSESTLALYIREAENCVNLLG